MEPASFFIAKRHRPQILARLQALGLVYTEGRARGGTVCTVMGDEDRLAQLQASLDEYWHQVDALNVVMKSGSPRDNPLSEYARTPSGAPSSPRQVTAHSRDGIAPSVDSGVVHTRLSQPGHERKPLRYCVRTYVVGGLIALLAVIGVVNWQSGSASRQQDDINHSTDAWHCVVHYGDQSNC